MQDPDLHTCTLLGPYRNFSKVTTVVHQFDISSSKISAARSSKSRFSDRNSFAVSRSDIPRSSGWWRWKAENFLLRLKKSPDEKYIFFMEKFDFEKKIRLFFKKVRDFFFKNFHIEKKYFHRNFLRFFEKSPIFFFKIKFLHDEKIFFVRIFFKVQEDVLSFPTQPTRSESDKY